MKPGLNEKQQIRCISINLMPMILIALLFAPGMLLGVWKSIVIIKNEPVVGGLCLAFVLLVLGWFLFFFIRGYQRESRLVGVSAEGFHLRDGSVYRFDQALEILPVGFAGFYVQFKGWQYKPLNLSPEATHAVFNFTRKYIEESAKKDELIKNINNHFKRQHSQSTSSIIGLALFCILLAFTPIIPPGGAVFVTTVGAVALAGGLYKKKLCSPKTFETFTVVHKYEW